MIIVVSYIASCGPAHGVEPLGVSDMTAVAKGTWEKATTEAYKAENRVKSVNNGKTIYGYKDTVKITGANYFWTREFDSVETAGSAVYCQGRVRNDTYAFKVRKKIGDPGWVLYENLELTSDSAPQPKRPVSYKPESLDHFAHMTIIDTPLCVILQSPVTKLETSWDAEGKRFYKMGFNYAKDLGKGRKEVAEGTLTVCDIGYIENDEYSVTTTTNGEIVTKYNIASKNECRVTNGVPILTSFSRVVTPIKAGDPAEGVTTRSGEFRVTYGQADESDFRLSAFGLPEPEGVVPPKKSTPAYLWLLSASAGSGFVAVVCYLWLLRRSKGTAPVLPAK